MDAMPSMLPSAAPKYLSLSSYSSSEGLASSKALKAASLSSCHTQSNFPNVSRYSRTVLRIPWTQPVSRSATRTISMSLVMRSKKDGFS